MRSLNRNEVALLDSLLSSYQEDMIKVLGKYLKKKGYSPVITKDYIIAKGSIPIALVAHMDTVFEKTGIDPAFPNLLYDKEKGMMICAQHPGFDDKAGIFAIIQILQSGLRPTVIFTTDEEIGSIGASVMVENYKEAPWDLRYLIQLDRRGTNDAVFYDDDNEEFHQYVEKFGFLTNIGSFSDISVICPAWGISGVNLSVGYKNEHSLSETLFVPALLDTISKVKRMLTVAEMPEQFKYISKIKYVPYSSNCYNWDLDNEPEYSSNCYKCKKKISFLDAIPGKTPDGKIVDFCVDCASDSSFGWCLECGYCFENPENKSCCPACEKEGSVWKNSSDKSNPF